eukprot:762976-Hanusia_phi.AAC.1
MSLLEALMGRKPLQAVTQDIVEKLHKLQPETGEETATNGRSEVEQETADQDQRKTGLAQTPETPNEQGQEEHAGVYTQAKVMNMEEWVQVRCRDAEPGTIISQNVNGCNYFILKHILAYLIESYQPSVILLQEVHANDKKETKLRQLIKQNWPCYRAFLSKSKQQTMRGKGDLRLMTLVHAALEPQPCQNQGDGSSLFFPYRAISIAIRNGTKITNVHQYPSSCPQGKQEDGWKALEDMVKSDNSSTHIIGGDFNAARLHTRVPMRTGYVQHSITNQIDHAFENFLGSIARHRMVVGETLSTDSTHMTFEAWAARGETQAKLDAVFALQKPDQAMPAIKLTSQT